MTVAYNIQLDGPNGAVRVASGVVTMAMGAGSQALPGFTGVNTTVVVSYTPSGFTGANAGHLQAVYNSGAGRVDVISDNAADDNDVYFWISEGHIGKLEGAAHQSD